MRTFEGDASGVVVDFGPSSATRPASSRLAVAALSARGWTHGGLRESDPAVMLGFVILAVASTMLATIVAVALLLVA